MAQARGEIRDGAPSVSIRPLVSAAVLILAVATVAHAGLEAAPRLDVLETSPSSPATLGRHRTFYLRFRVDAPFPVVVALHPYERGVDVLRAMGNGGEPTLPAGESTDAGFFFLLAKEPQHVDEVRIVVSRADDRRTQWTFPHPVDLAFDPADTSPAPPDPGWVNDWKVARDARFRAAAEAAGAGPGSLLGWAVALVVIPILVLLPLAAVALPLYFLWRWRGPRRLLAALPLVVLGGKLATVWADLAADPTSHNLWPLELLLWELPALGVVLLAWVFGPKEAPPA